MKLNERLRRRLRVELSRDWLLVPGGSRAAATVAHLLVIGARPTPTLDYYLRELFDGEFQSAQRIVFDDELADFSNAKVASAIAPGTRVILVRMPSSGWARVIAAAGANVVEVVWLIDDDIVAAREDEHLPSDYRLRLLSDYARFKQAFASQIDRVWASTPSIAARYPQERVEVRPPRQLRPSFASPSVSIFYHGTAAHRAEHSFLLPIFEAVQARSQRTVIEIVGDHALYRMFRRVPRLRVLHPMGWPDYLAHLHAGKYDIGLAPLLDTPFNRGRSGVKALEIASIGAQGILSRRAPYTNYAELPGMHLVGDQASEWVDQILKLAERPIVDG